ncbi:MAG: response regulator transcription factor [Salinivirgaceae bacterium]|nr:response regulator transcription factor [Salinivirgaceae bacterium]MDD4745663.1 response regulator transcription factor [Salinivirgaceae bacterium]MDY0279311.1 response regulator transcription factor [Salinivirgaceae bacterium]
MKKKHSIFLVEDDINFGTVLRSYLEMNQFDVEWIDDGQRAIEEFTKGKYDLCILDIMLPHADGYTIAKHVRANDPIVPFIFLTAKTLKEDMIEGFRLGADDYITKPFDSEVLLYKIKAIIRRRQELFQGKDNPLSIGKYEYIPTTRILKLENSEERLSPKEGKLLYMLAKNVNQVVVRDIVLREIWGDSNYFTARSMDVYITKLRKFLKEDSSLKIENIHGSGYMLVDKD